MGHFYPRPPRGGRPRTNDYIHGDNEFLSTPSARRATWKLLESFLPSNAFLSTPSARRATSTKDASSETSGTFLSTPSARRATTADEFIQKNEIGISIHALREEGDIPKCGTLGGEREFLSTPSARRATDHPAHAGSWQNISIHALREEGDERTAATLPPFQYFYPRPPRGGRHFGRSGTSNQ